MLNDSLFCLLKETGIRARDNIIEHRVLRLKQKRFNFGNIQSILDEYYSENNVFKKTVTAVELCFVNDEFVFREHEKIEAFKRNISGILFYHKEFFSCPVSYYHITDRMLEEVRKDDWNKDINIWFHLRGNFLFIAGCEGNKLNSLNVFEVHKTLDVFYYLLFNVRNLYPDDRPISGILASGDLLLVEEVGNLLSENFPGIQIITPTDIKESKLQHSNNDYKYYPEISY